MRGKSDTAATTHDLRKRARDEKTGIRLLAAPTLTQRSGQRAKAESGTREYISGYGIDQETGWEVPVTDTCLAGSCLETDPDIGADGVTLEINIVVEHALEEPELKERTVIGPVSGTEQTVYTALENNAKLITGTTLRSGQTRLLGSIPSKKDDALILVFLFGEVVAVSTD